MAINTGSSQRNTGGIVKESRTRKNLEMYSWEEKNGMMKLFRSATRKRPGDEKASKTDESRSQNQRQLAHDVDMS